MEKEAKTLPKITINKIIKESLPEEVKCTSESQQLILQCCMEFLQLISSEANEICSKQNKKVIVPDHILIALQKLGFEKYIPDLKVVHAEHKRQEANKPKISKRLEDSGLSQEELLRKQKELFAKAKSAVKNNNKQQDDSDCNFNSQNDLEQGQGQRHDHGQGNVHGHSQGQGFGSYPPPFLQPQPQPQQFQPSFQQLQQQLHQLQQQHQQQHQQHQQQLPQLHQLQPPPQLPPSQPQQLQLNQPPLQQPPQLPRNHPAYSQDWLDQFHERRNFT